MDPTQQRTFGVRGTRAGCCCGSSAISAIRELQHARYAFRYKGLFRSLAAKQLAAHPLLVASLLPPYAMTHSHRVLQAIIVSCLLCIPSIAFGPLAIPAAPLQEQQRESADSAAPGKEHAQSRRRPTMMATRHGSSIPRNGCIYRQSRQSRSTELRAANGGGASDREGFLKRVAAWTFAAAGLSTAAVVVGRPEEASAFCGEPYPYWAYFMDFDELLIPFQFEGFSGKLFARTVGNGKEQKKVRSGRNMHSSSSRVLSAGTAVQRKEVPCTDPCAHPPFDAAGDVFVEGVMESGVMRL